MLNADALTLLARWILEEEGSDRFLKLSLSAVSFFSRIIILKRLVALSLSLLDLLDFGFLDADFPLVTPILQ
jgi:hypothetical protein